MLSEAIKQVNEQKRVEKALERAMEELKWIADKSSVIALKSIDVPITIEDARLHAAETITDIEAILKGEK